MKLICSVEDNNRNHDSDKRKKPLKTRLSIGKLGTDKNDLFLLLQNNQNKQGVKYKLSDNIEIVYTNFINDGKMTIRLKEPARDILIKCDAIQLKSFAHFLKLAYTNKTETSVLPSTNLKVKKIFDSVKTKLTIKSASSYPVLEGFPRTIVELNLSGLERKSFDRNILKLHNLRTLDLSDNRISSLPTDLGKLANLQELNISSNLLHKCPDTKWIWMEQLQISKNLKLLDLSSNQLRKLPDQIGKLSSLVTLRLNTNLLEHLPQNLGSLECLKYLEVSKNRLVVLPGGLRNLRLISINLSDNSFIPSENYYLDNLKLPSLVELGAKVVLNSRIHYNSSIIPMTLMPYLNNSRLCVCGKACFDSYIRKSVDIALMNIACSVISSGYSQILPFDCFYCSYKCKRRFAN